jgi:hypothetical protein
MTSETEKPTEEGVLFKDVDGRRSSQRAGKAILADAVRATDQELASRIERMGDYRKKYIEPFRKSVELGAASAKGALRIAADGLNALHENLTFLRDGEESTIPEALAKHTRARFETHTISGTGERVQRLEVPYRGQTLHGDALRRQLDDWEERGVLEASSNEALNKVIDDPGMLDLRDRRFVLLGAASEMGPLESLSAWGAEISAIDLPRPRLWDHIISIATRGAGKLHVPVSSPVGNDSQVSEKAGTDLLVSAPEVRTWINEIDGELTLGNYVYADGANFMRLQGAVDAIVADVTSSRPGVSLAHLATPTDVYAVPEEIAREVTAAQKASLVKGAVRAVSRSNLYQRNYPRLIEGEDGTWGIADSLVPIQGPNYALSKALQRWRATTAREEGFLTSVNIAPASNTTSVVKNKMLAAVYRGAPSFGVEIFQPDTARVVMAALLVHDLRNGNALSNPSIRLDHPFHLFAQGAIHGGIWRLPYQPRSILPLGLVVGIVKRS